MPPHLPAADEKAFGHAGSNKVDITCIEQKVLTDSFQTSMSAVSITEIGRDDGPASVPATAQSQVALKELYTSSHHAPVPVSLHHLSLTLPLSISRHNAVCTKRAIATSFRKEPRSDGRQIRIGIQIHLMLIRTLVISKGRDKYTDTETLSAGYTTASKMIDSSHPTAISKG